MCSAGQYYNKTCQECRKRCPNCGYDNLTDYVYCVACPEESHRLNSPEYHCPCEPGYVENPKNLTTYCCDKRCLTCNSTGCLSCSTKLYREMSNNTQACVCKAGFIEQSETGTCGCPSQHFLFNSTCLLCPPQCAECVYKGGRKKVCTLCREGMNRNVSLAVSSPCGCLDGFEETFPIGPYCYPRGCANQELICTKCIDKRIITDGGLKC